jgi:NAD(P)-dependent dehydrogenase (short-subunit alcohol dehydrogenase family)
MSSYALRDKVVIVTGATGGIGTACTKALIGRGAKVVLVDLAQDGLNALAATLPKAQVLPLAADVTNLRQMSTVAEQAVAKLGRIDVVFANAGIALDPPATVAVAEVDAYERVIEVDLLGVWRTVKSCLAEIIQNQGYVLVTASVYAFVNGMVNSAYAVSKAGVEMFGRSLRAELAQTGASAGVLYPGWVTTPLTEGSRGGNETATRMVRRAFRGPLGKFIQPEQVAQAVVTGIEKRAARIVIPKVWVPISLMRGLFNAAADAGIERDAQLAELTRQIETEARSRPARPPAPPASDQIHQHQ